MTPYEMGKLAALQKFGLDAVSKPLTRSEAQLPLETEDSQTPVGLLAGALRQLPEPISKSQRSTDGNDSVEDRLNRQTSWSSPFTIPLNAAEGPSPIWSGFGI
jgi:hypothetical protein